MSDDSIRFFPLGDTALTVEFGTQISEAVNRKALSLARHFERNPFPGFIEAVPSYSSTTVFYDLVTVRKHFPRFPTASAAVMSLASSALNGIYDTDNETPRNIEIPMDCSKASALDLEFIAANSGISKNKVIEIFTSATYRVYMMGFLPGFSYMGEVDERIATPRKATPRLLVPKGSVGIAGKQTGIYSLESPGGWQIIGRTDIEMFTPNDATPSFLRPGDLVRFVSV